MVSAVDEVDEKILSKSSFSSIEIAEGMNFPTPKVINNTADMALQKKTKPTVLITPKNNQMA